MIHVKMLIKNASHTINSINFLSLLILSGFNGQNPGIYMVGLFKPDKSGRNTARIILPLDAFCLCTIWLFFFIGTHSILLIKQNELSKYG